MRLYDTVRSAATLPVFATGGPARTPFTGPGTASWTEPAFALHHAESWGGGFVLGYMLPLQAVATSPDGDFAPARERWLSTLSALAAAAGGRPLVAQVWGPLSLLAEAAGTSLLVHDIAHEATVVERAVAPHTERTLALTDAAIDAGADIVWVAEPMVALLDPVSVRVHATPLISRISALAHAHDRDVVVHSSGEAAHALPGLAAARVDGVSITSGTPLEATAALPANVVVFGNLDRAELLSLDEAALGQAARTMAATMRGRPFVATPGSALPANAPVSHLSAFLDSARSEPGMGAPKPATER